MADGTSSPATGAPATLEVRRTFRASPQRVFNAWTSAEAIRRWFSPENASVENAAVDFRVGGSYRVDIRDSNGNLHVVGGQYRQIDAPRRIVFSWRWENHPHATDTVVSVEFIEHAEGTEVVLVQEGLVTEQDRAGHRHGWIGCLEKLDAFV